MKKYEDILDELDKQSYRITDVKNKVAEDSLVDFLCLLTKISLDYNADISINASSFVIYIDKTNTSKIPANNLDEIKKIEDFFGNRYEIYEDYMWSFLEDKSIKELTLKNGVLYGSKSTLEEKIVGEDKQILITGSEIKMSFYAKYEKELMSATSMDRKNKGFKI